MIRNQVLQVYIKQIETHVAPAMINSIVLDLVNSENISRKQIVDIITMMMRAEIVLTMLQMITGVRRSSVIRINRIAFAVS